MTLTFRRFAYPALIIGAAVGLIMYRGITGIPGRPPAHYAVDRGMAMVLCGLGMSLGAYLFAWVDWRKKRSRVMTELLGAGQGIFLGVLYFYAYIIFGRDVTLLGGLTAMAYAGIAFLLFWKIINAWGLSPVGKTEAAALQIFSGGLTTLVAYLIDAYFPPVIWLFGGA